MYSSYTPVLGNCFSSDSIHQPQAVDVYRFFARAVADAENVKAVKRIRADLNAGTDFAEFGRTFQHHRFKSITRQPERGSDATNAAAGDNNGKLVHRLY
jgi:hypothetical protein